MKRRTFLETLAVGAAAFTLPTLGRPRLARAAAAPRSFVIAYFRGGWDTLLCLDPRDPAVFTEARKAETRIELGWDLLPNTFERALIQPAGAGFALGPVMGGLARHYDKMCVVRGMSMNTVAHEVGRRYFTTGMTPRGSQAAGSAIGTRIAAQQGDLSAFPNLVVKAETYNDGLPSFASGLTVNSVADLITTLTEGPDAPPPAVRRHLDALRAGKATCDPTAKDRRGLLTQLGESQVKARALVTSGLSGKFDFTSRTDPEMSALAQRYGITDLAQPQAQAAMAFQALRYELAQCVTVELASDLDSHDDSWQDEHPNQLATAFTALGTLVDDLANTPDPSRGGTLLEHTTILCFSEFGRTALLNARGGRDHSLTSSCLLLGAGVPGNRVVGASSDVAMTPQAVDPDTGAVSEDGMILTPTLVVASMMEAAGYDTTALRTSGLPCLMA